MSNAGKNHEGYQDPTAMGYTEPPPSGAIVPDAGETDPNGDEGARE